jgi:periplasmic protein TonB
MNASSTISSQRIFWFVAGAHIVALVGFTLYGLVKEWIVRLKPAEQVVFVTLHTPSPPPEAVAPEVPEPPPPEPEPPSPIPEPTPKPPIEISTNRVVRKIEEPIPPPELTKEQIGQNLMSDMPTTQGSVSSSATADAGWYYALVQQTLNDAWVEPSSGIPGSITSVKIRVMRDGSITRRDMVKGSGDPDMDESVMRAVQSVTRLRPLPSVLEGAHHDITIDFELTGAQF